MKKICYMLLACIMMLFNVSFVGAEDGSEDSGYVLEVVSPESLGIQLGQDLPNPYTLYIMNVHTHITDKGDGKIHMGVEVYCTHTMKEITTTFYLQQLISNKWVDVCEVTSTADDSSFMIKFISVSYPPSGSYRVRTITMVEDYNGYVEAAVGNSGDIDFVSPYT